MFALRHGQDEAFACLMRHGANLELTNAQGLTVLLLACQLGRLEIVQKLVQAGANVARQDRNGRNAIELARVHGHGDIEAFLFGFTSTDGLVHGSCNVPYASRNKRMQN